MRRPSVSIAVGLALAFALAGCGGTPVRQGQETDGELLAGPGMSIELPAGWSGRILLGADGRPVLHAANFPLPTNDDDGGSVAQEIIGGPGQLYVNVRDLATGGDAEATDVVLGASDFHPATNPVRFLTVARRDFDASGTAYRLTAVSGSENRPAEGVVEQLNDVLATLRTQTYEAEPTSPPSSEPINGYGVAMALPPGWQGRVSAGELRAEGDGITVRLLERAGSNPPFVSARLPLRLSASEFVPDGAGRIATGRTFLAHGRTFLLDADAGASPPDETAVAAANAALVSLTIQPGDFYPGTVEPATFAPADGWDTGTSGPAEIEPGGYGTFTWASTVPYGDPPNQLPPSDTLTSLPPDGIVIVAWLFTPAEPEPVRLPLAVDDAVVQHEWEGQVRDLPLYRLTGTARGQYSIDVWMIFGRREPTREQLDRAQAQLDHLRLPDWSG